MWISLRGLQKYTNDMLNSDIVQTVTLQSLNIAKGKQWFILFDTFLELINKQKLHKDQIPFFIFFKFLSLLLTLTNYFWW